MKLLVEVSKRMKDVGISPKDRIDIYNFLRILKVKDNNTYTHSVRVALLAADVAKTLNIDEKALLMAGCLHDIGKSMIDPLILNKPDFNEEDMEKVKDHALYSYNILLDKFDFTADIVVRHHCWQEGGYPAKLPEFKFQYSDETKQKIDFYSRILSLVDFYDAITTRKNQKYKTQLDTQEIKNIIFEKNKDISDIVQLLYDREIFV